MSGIDYKSCFSVLFATIPQKKKKPTVSKLFMGRPLKKTKQIVMHPGFVFFSLPDVDIYRSDFLLILEVSRGKSQCCGSETEVSDPDPV
jgi:hypothetical protein